MEYLRFDNGFEISAQELAAKIRTEGHLGTDNHLDEVSGLRCALGVALNTQVGDQVPNTTPMYTGDAITDYNDNFIVTETPEERAERMAIFVEGEIWALDPAE